MESESESELGSELESDSIERFLSHACSVNCAAVDKDFEGQLEKAKVLLSQLTESQRENLSVAAAIGDVSTVQRLIQKDGSSVTQVGGPHQWPPLLYLCFSRFMRDTDQQRINDLITTAEWLLSNGAEANSYFMLGDERETALYAACGICNNAALAQLLLDHGAMVNDEDATYHVAEFSATDCIRVLFENGLDADRQATVLLRKLDFEDFDGVQAILDLGCDVNHQGYWNKSPLHQAIMRGRSLAIVKLLIDRGADVNAIGQNAATPYYLACLHGRDDVIDLLVAHQASTDLSPQRQCIAYASLGQLSQAKTSQLQVSQQQLGADAADAFKNECDQAFILAGKAGNLSGLQCMLELDFEIGASDGQGFTALHWAAWFGHLDCVTLLIDKGAPVEAENNYGGTVIDSTVWGYANSNGDDRNCREILKLLAAAGADPFLVSPFPSGHAQSDQVIAQLRQQRSA